MKAAIPIILLILLVVGHAIGLQLSSRKDMEESLAAEAETALLKSGVIKPQVEVVVDHRDVKLAGSTTQNVDQVKDLVRQALSAGKGRLQSSIGPMPAAVASSEPLNPPSLSLHRKNGMIEVNGNIPDDDIRQDILSAVQTMEPDTPIDGGLKIGDRLSAPLWLTKFGYWWPRLHAMNPNATFDISGDILKVFGEADAPEDVQTMKSNLAGIIGDKIEINTDGVKLPLSPPDLEIRRNGNGQAVLMGSLPTPKYRNQILTAVQKSEPELEAANQMKVGKYLEEPAWLKNFDTWWPLLQKSIPNASIEIKNNRLRITGEAADADAKGKIPGLLTAHLGSGFSVDAESVTKPQLLMPELEVSRTGNLIAVSGKVPQQQLDAITQALSQGGANVKTEGLKGGKNFSNPNWLANIGSWWPDLVKLMPDASFSMSSSGLTVKGSATEEDSEAKVRNLIAGFDGNAGKNAKLSIDPLKAPQLSLAGDLNSLKIEGAVANAGEKSSILKGFGKAKVDAAKLTAGERIHKSEWSSTIGSYMTNLIEDVGPVRLTIDGYDANISADITDAAQKKQIIDDLKVVMGGRYKVAGDFRMVEKPTEAPKVAMTDTKPAEPAAPKTTPAPTPMKEEPKAMSEEPKKTPAPEPKKEEPVKMVKAEPKPEPKMVEPKKDEPQKEEPAKEVSPLPLGEVAETFYFDKNSSYLSSAEKQKLLKFSQTLQDHTNTKLKIVLVGHADYRGDKDYNIWLSERRAKRVLDSLKEDGFNGNAEMEIRALGEENAASAKAGESAWRKDRRVDVLIQKN